MTPRILVAPGIATEAAARGRPRVGYASSPRYRGRAYAVIPFVAPDGPVGAICLTDLPADEIPRRDRLDTWSEWARHAGAFLRTALDLRGARESALTDPKTALPNARAFQAALTREHERVRRSGGAYGVAVFDIDRFKAVNTELTHPIADRVLVAVAGELKASFREADLVSRWGGEEFAVLLTDPDAPEGEAGDRLLHAVDRARGRVEDHPTRLEGREDPYRVTVSAGLAVYPEDAAGPDSLVEGAFAALGAAKHAGRNRVHRRRAR
jgi:diguanylate cyclase (GGDEF)-like protein